MRNIMELLSVITLLWFLIPTGQVNCKRILLVTPAPSYSHQIVHHAVGLALHKRGHDVTIITANPKKDPTLTNYTEIDVSSTYKYLDNGTTVGTKYRLASSWEQEQLIREIQNKISYSVYNHSDVQKIYATNSNEKFDAVIVEMVIGPALHAMAYRLNATLIGIATLDMHRYEHYMMGNPVLSSHPSIWEHYETAGVNLPFLQRVHNFIRFWRTIYYWKTHLVVEQDKIVKHFLGDDTPHVLELAKRTSICLVNQNPALSYARPIQQNIIWFSGIHIAEKPPSLPKVVKNFLDGATEGFIYMSLGTNMRSTELPPKSLEYMMNVFSKLPYRVLWKYEGELPKKLSNVLTAKWIPQQGVLAHPKIKLFIYQGGLQSTEEAVYYGVPLIGIPVMYDQGYRVKKLVSLNVAKQLAINEITESTFYSAIFDMVTDKGYKRRMLELSMIIKDNPIRSIDKVVWWIEYAIRHKGATHLQFSGLEEPYYQQYDMDIIAFFAIFLFITLLILASMVLFVLHRSYRWILNYSQTKAQLLYTPTSKDKKIK